METDFTKPSLDHPRTFEDGLFTDEELEVSRETLERLNQKFEQIGMPRKKKKKKRNNDDNSFQNTMSFYWSV